MWNHRCPKQLLEHFILMECEVEGLDIDFTAGANWYSPAVIVKPVRVMARFPHGNGLSYVKEQLTNRKPLLIN